MRLSCAKPLAFIGTGLSFLKPGLTNIHFDNIALAATALVLGSGFNLSRISRMWLEDNVVSTLSFFLSDAKFSVPELQLLYPRNAVLVPESYLSVSTDFKRNQGIHGGAIVPWNWRNYSFGGCILLSILQQNW